MLYTRSAAMHSEMIRSLLQQSLRGLPAVPAVPIPVPEKRSNVRIGLQRLVENHLNDAERQRALTVILDMKPGYVFIRHNGIGVYLSGLRNTGF